jgi:hypothetical protein
VFRTALGPPPQPPIQWVPWALSLEVKLPGSEADHSPPSSAEVKNVSTSSWRGAYLSTGTTLLLSYTALQGRESSKSTSDVCNYGRKSKVSVCVCYVCYIDMNVPLSHDCPFSCCCDTNWLSSATIPWYGRGNGCGRRTISPVCAYVNVYTRIITEKRQPTSILRVKFEPLTAVSYHKMRPPKSAKHGSCLAGCRKKLLQFLKKAYTLTAYIRGSRDSSVSIGTRLRAGRPEIAFRQGQLRPDRLWGPPSLLCTGCQGVKLPGHEADHSV